MARPPTPVKPHVPPVFPPRLESATRESLSVFLMQMGLLPNADAGHLEPLKRCIEDMADALFEGDGRAFDVHQPVPVRDHHYAHPARVAELSMILTRLAGGRRADARCAGMAALLMNLGYVGMQGAILGGGSELPPNQGALIREHPAAGVAMLERGGLDDDVLRAIAGHHERWDGSGYPDGLKGNAISTPARIIAVADTCIALASPRPYRTSMRDDDIIQLFRVEAGQSFDPRVVRVLLDELPNWRRT